MSGSDVESDDLLADITTS